MKFKKTTLPNGLRIITAPSKSPAVTVMVLVKTGSNYESKEQSGLSHFLEHMCFKGTTNRPTSMEISRELDGIGAENNAFTSNEWTSYYAKAEKKHFKKLIEVVSDLYLNPTVPAPELEKERGVILQELSMYEDMPHRKVEEVLMELLYGDTSFGRPIGGFPKNIKRFSRDDFMNYRNKHYLAEKTIVVVSGDINSEAVEKEIKKYFTSLKRGKKPAEPVLKESQKSPAIKIHHKKTDQTHMIMGFRAFGANDKRIPTLGILATILGRGMSSRLFQKMREEMGVCYYVRATADEYTKYGVFSIAAGIDTKRSEEVIKALIEECTKLKNVEVSDQELDKAKEHFVGGLYMGLETSDALAYFYADQEVKLGKLKTPEEVEKIIRNVKAKDIKDLANTLFQNDRLNLAVVGNLTNENSLKKALRFK